MEIFQPTDTIIESGVTDISSSDTTINVSSPTGSVDIGVNQSYDYQWTGSQTWTGTKLLFNTARQISFQLQNAASFGINLVPDSSNAGTSLRFIDTSAIDDSGKYVGFVAPNNIPSSLLWTLPKTDSTGTQALVSNGVGTLSWASTGTGTVTSVDVSGGTTGLTTSGGPITSSGTITLAGTLITSNGGTGINSWLQGDIPYFTSGTALSKLNKNTTATRYIQNGGTNNAPVWAQVDLTNGVTGILPVTNGGTGVSTGYTFSTGLNNASGTITAKLATGFAGSQSVIGGTASGESLTLSSTTNATKGSIIFGSSNYNESINCFGLGTTAVTGSLISIAGSLSGRTQLRFTAGTLPSSGITSGDVSYTTAEGFRYVNTTNNYVTQFTDGTTTFGFYLQNTGINANIGTASNHPFGIFTNASTVQFLFGTNKCHFIGGNTTPTAFADIAASTTSIASMRVRAGTAPTSPNEGDMWADSTQKAMIQFADGIKQVMSNVLFTQTASQTVTNTVTETTIIGTGVGTLTLPANFFVAGKTIRMRIGGIYTTPLAAVPSLLIKVKYGTTIIATVTTTSLLSGATNLEFDGEILITCRTTGATGTVMTHGDIEYATGVAGTISVDPLNNAGATTTIDTTASSALNVTIQWDTNTSTRSATSTITTVEVLN